jgi:hypothetical protein
MAFVFYMDQADAVAGAPADESKFDPEEWQYMLEHGIVVVQGSPKDPKVIEASRSGVGYEDPRDQRIAELEEQLAAAKKSPTNPQQQTPAKQETTQQSSSEDKK